MRTATPAPVRRLVVNADDFAFTPGVTAGILEAHAAGAVTSTSMLVHCPGWEHGVRALRTAPTLGVGLHFNLLVGAPLAGTRSLRDTRSGRFHSLAGLVARALAGRIDAADVAAECEAQLAALRDAGIACTHIDSHRHTHALPVIRGAVAAIASRLNVPLRRPVEAHLRMPGGVGSHLQRAAVSLAWMVTSAGATPTRSTDRFIGVSMQGADRFAERFASALAGLAPGTTEIMVHPGRVDDALTAIDGYTWQRERELAALTSPMLRERLRRADLALVDFRAV